MRKTFCAAVLLCGFLCICTSPVCGDQWAELISVEKIWDYAPHNAFTDLVRYDDCWWCTFRESSGHAADDGKIRVIVSDDGSNWTSAALMSQPGLDLRDPKLSIMPDGRLMCNMGGTLLSTSGEYLTRSSRVAFSSDGYDWTVPKDVMTDTPPTEDHWLWRVTWHDGVAWSMSKLGVGYDPRRIMLYNSTNGIDWNYVAEPIIPDNAQNGSETTLRFLPDDTMVALTRPEWIGTSQSPYTDWQWTKMNETMGGPNFIQLPDESLWASARCYIEPKRTVLAKMTTTSYQRELDLPSGGDNSYAGMVYNDADGLIWMSYYSSHEGTSTDIYLAKVKIHDAQVPPGYKVMVATDGLDLPQSVDKIHSYDSAGTFLSTFEDPWPESHLRWSGLEVGPDGNVYGCSFNYKSVYRWNPADGSYIDRFTEAPLEGGTPYIYDVTDMTFGPDGDLYVANERAGYGVVKFDGDTGAYLGQFVDPEGLGYFRALEFGPDGYLYAGRGGQVNRYDPDTGEYVDTYINNADSVTGLEWHDGDLYVACAGETDTVRCYTDANTYTDFITSGLGGLDNPKDMVWTPDGELLVTSYVGLNGVLRYDAATGEFIDTFCTVSEYEAPKALALIETSSASTSIPEPGTLVMLMLGGLCLAVGRFRGESNRLLLSAIIAICCCTAQSAQAGWRLAVATEGYDSTAPGTDTLFSCDSSGAVEWSTAPLPDIDARFFEVELGPGNTDHPTGLLYVLSYYWRTIYRFDPIDGSYVDRFASGMGMWNPTDLTFGPDGSLYVTNENNGWGLSKYDTSGTFLGQFVDNSVQTSMHGVTFGPDGDIYIGGSGTVERYDGDTGAYVANFAGGLTSFPAGLVWHDGDLYVADRAPVNAIRRYDSSGTPVGDGLFVDSGSGGLEGPTDFVWTPDGDLLVSSRGYPSGAAAVLRYDGTTGAFIDAFATFTSGDPADWPKGLALIPVLVPGDANGDDYVNVTDLGILATNYGAGGGFGWGDGDFTGDGFVNVSDLGILATSYGTVPTATAVPEPSMFAGLLGLCLAGLLDLKRRRQF